MGLNDKVNEAVVWMEQGYNCAQAVLAAVSPELGLGQGEAFRVAAAFGGGVARSGRTCGAVIGGLMAIGLHSDGKPDSEEKDRIYGLAQEFMERFSGSNQALDCRELIGCDLATPEGREKARSEQIVAQRCPLLVKSAIEILAQMGVSTPTRTELL